MIWLVIVIKIILLTAVIWLILFFTQKKTLVNSTPITLEVVKGQGLKEIVQELKDNSIIKNKLTFYWLYFVNHRPLQAGIYLFKPNQSTREIYNIIASGQINEQKITIIEGWRREQIAQMLNKQNLVDYETFMAVSEGKEGRLFPDTYRIAKNSTGNDIVDAMLKNYELKTKTLHPNSDQLIIASIVEREAKQDEDRAQIATVFYNRLKIGMKLESDVTVEYGLDDNRLESILQNYINDFKFWTSLKPGESKSTISSFNTYKIPALTPNPICNPGLKSIEAAVKPAQNDYYYFYSDKQGKAHFAKTKAEHDDNIKKYSN